MIITVDKKIREFSDFLAKTALLEAECYPIDRYFLKPYIESILQMDRNSFLLYNLEKVNNNYSIQLLLCLPELWQNITVDDIVEILYNFTNIFSFYALITFTYKYIEVNIIELILNLNKLNPTIKFEIKDFLGTQYPNLVKSEGEIFTIDESLIGVSTDDWMYIKQILLCNKKLKPAFTSLKELKAYIETIAY
jgi:hypothetical protein